MKFRPCIDIHNGAVKQIVGKTLKDDGNRATDNFISSHQADYFAELYRRDGFFGGHVIMLNAKDSAYFEKTKEQALRALRAFPGGLMIGGGITDRNAGAYLDAGASHVITTSFVFRDGKIDREALRSIKETVGRERLVLDLSCRKRDDCYYVVTDRWQKFTEEPVTWELLEELRDSCAEFLIHAVDVEGQVHGIERSLVGLLGQKESLPITYAGGISDFSDLDLLKELGCGRLDATIGSALDLFGGKMKYEKVKEYFENIKEI